GSRGARKAGRDGTAVPWTRRSASGTSRRDSRVRSAWWRLRGRTGLGACQSGINSGPRTTPRSRRHRGRAGGKPPRGHNRRSAVLGSSLLRLMGEIVAPPSCKGTARKEDTRPAFFLGALAEHAMNVVVAGGGGITTDLGPLPHRAGTGQ